MIPIIFIEKSNCDKLWNKLKVNDFQLISKMLKYCDFSQDYGLIVVDKYRKQIQVRKSSCRQYSHTAIVGNNEIHFSQSIVFELIYNNKLQRIIDVDLAEIKQGFN